MVATAVSAHLQYPSAVKGWAPMTLYELSQSYKVSAEQVRTRIKELEQAKKTESVPWRVKALDGRISKLRSLYRDASTVAKYLENYYSKFEPQRGAKRMGRRGGL